MVTTERSVEVPFCLSRCVGPTLDIGAAESDYLDKLPKGSVGTDLRPPTKPSPIPFVQANVKKLPFDNESFQTVLCLSTLEHFGRAHKPYGTHEERYVVDKAIREMWRVTKVGGNLLITLPFGLHQDHGWFMQWSPKILDNVFPDRYECIFYKYDRNSDKYIECLEEDLKDTPYDTSVMRANGVVCFSLRKEKPFYDTIRSSTIS